MAENRKNPQSSTDEKPASSLLGPDTFWELGEKGEFFLALGLAFFLNAALRLIEYGPWQHDAYWMGGEPLMATHDAYAWLEPKVWAAMCTGPLLELFAGCMS